MLVRHPHVADRFYPADPVACRADIERYLTQEVDETNLPAEPLGGVVPHAGWTFSGTTLGAVFGYLRKKCTPHTVVLAGTVHVPNVEYPTTSSKGVWETPVRPIELDTELAEALISSGQVWNNPAAHEHEHSLEVIAPFVAYAFPEAKLVPLMVPVTTTGVDAGTALADAVRRLRRNVLLLASTDLTHYGPAYRYTPWGVGQMALDWVKQQNDRIMIDAMARMAAEDLLFIAQERRNACGPAAAAAVIAAGRTLGATRAHVVRYTTSHDVLPRGEPSDFVGYVGMVF